jgi:hypothetical protein
MRAARLPRTRRGRWTAALLALLVLAGAAASVVVVTRAGDGTSHTAVASGPTVLPSEPLPPADPGHSVALATAPPTAVPAPVVAELPGLPKALPAVPLDQPTAYGDGTSARIASIRAFDARGMGAGEFSGPALAVTVAITNTSSAPVSLDTVAVNLYAGATRAATLKDGATAPFHGSLAPGATATAVYPFSVPVAARDAVTVTVGISATTGRAVFSGPVS